MMKCKQINIDELNKRYPSLDSLKTDNGKLNSAITRRNWFCKLDIYKKVITSTKELEKFNGGDISFAIRFGYLVGEVSVGSCPHCGRQYLNAPRLQKMYRFCSCKMNYTDESSKKAVQARTKSIQSFIDTLNNAHFLLQESKFLNLLDELFHAKPNYAFGLLKHQEFYHDLIIKTRDVLQIDVDDLKISQRLYLAYNKIFKDKDLPRCKRCKKEKTGFINRFKGYSSYCPKCIGSVVGKSIHATTLKKIDEALDSHGRYEVLEYPTNLNYDDLVIKCKKCSSISRLNIGCGILSRLKDLKLCSNCERPRGSKPEEMLFRFIKRNYAGTILRNTRKIIPPLELDIYLPELKLAFEFNGMFWHSTANKKAVKVEMINNRSVSNIKSRHYLKTKMCEKYGITLFHIFEDDFINSRQLIQYEIRKYLNFDSLSRLQLIDVKEISSKEANEFHTQHTILRQTRAPMNFGIYVANSNIMVAAASISKPRFNNKYQFELQRFSSNYEIEDREVFALFLKWFENKYHPESIVYYADKFFPTHQFLDGSGFVVERELRPSYWLVDGKTKQRIDKQLYPSKESCKSLPAYDPNKTLRENLETNQLFKIYDCGKLVFVKRY